MITSDQRITRKNNSHLAPPIIDLVDVIVGVWRDSRLVGSGYDERFEWSLLRKCIKPTIINRTAISIMILG